MSSLNRAVVTFSVPYQISFGEYNAKLETGDYLKPRVISDSLNESCNDRIFRIVSFAK